jgi:putative FmdB family regulatory protein
MPTYEYECKECSHSFEVFQAMSDEPLKICPRCGKEVRRLIFGGAGVIFKGSGFYVTDKNKGPGGKTSGTESKTADTSSGATQSTTASPCAEAKKTGACGENCPVKTGAEGKSRKGAQTA